MRKVFVDDLAGRGAVCFTRLMVAEQHVVAVVVDVDHAGLISFQPFQPRRLGLEQSSTMSTSNGPAGRSCVSTPALVRKSNFCGKQVVVVDRRLVCPARQVPVHGKLRPHAVAVEPHMGRNKKRGIRPKIESSSDQIIFDFFQ